MYHMVHYLWEMSKDESSDAGPRARLLGSVIAQMQQTGVSDLSLRELATAIGTSHRMLLYHFGSREGLLVAVVRAVEEAQRDFLLDLALDPCLSPTEMMRTMWQRLADPGLWPNERLFFELYAQALQGRPGVTELLDGIVDDWVTPFADLAVQREMAPDDAAAEARLGVAVTRGLLLDLLATGDRAAVDAAMERYIAHVASVLETDSNSANGEQRASEHLSSGDHVPGTETCP
jgi:AcrR family transcriptional regulator